MFYMNAFSSTDSSTGHREITHEICHNPASNFQTRHKQAPNNDWPTTVTTVNKITCCDTNTYFTPHLRNHHSHSAADFRPQIPPFKNKRKQNRNRTQSHVTFLSALLETWKQTQCPSATDRNTFGIQAGQQFACWVRKSWAPRRKSPWPRVSTAV